MKSNYIELFEAATQTCRACKIKPDEKVVVYTDTTKNETLIDAFYNACVATGAETILVVSKAYKVPLKDPPLVAIAAMESADIVFDLATQPWLYTQSTNQIIAGGTRMLQVLADENSIINRPPNEEIASRADKLAPKLRGETIHIFSDLGTDFVVQRKNRPVHWQDGRVITPGDWDSLAVIVAAFAPLETEAEGLIMLNGPIYLSPRLNFHVETPVRFVVKEGRIVEVTGGKEAQIINRYFHDFGDPNAKVIAHTGFGMDPRADIWAADIGNWESYDGGINVAFGGNNISQLQGKTACRSHIDMILLDSSITVDGKLILNKGKFV